MIVLFTRDANKYGQVMKEHMTLLAQSHMEARFVWVDAENAPFLTDKLNIWMLPTIVCIVDNKVKEQHNGALGVGEWGRPDAPNPKPNPTPLTLTRPQRDRR